MQNPSRPPKRLSELIDGLAVGDVADDPIITGLSDDSRLVQPGDLFVARDLQYLDQAITQGALAAIVPPGTPPRPDAILLAADQIDQPLAGRLADRFYDAPSQNLLLLGITGTNGKTTVAWLTQYLLQQAGLKTGMIGTICMDTGQSEGPTSSDLTTPGAIQLRQALAQMRDNGCQAAVMEVSSHALDQGRTAGLDFHAACYTNLTQDHLDYHGSMDAYAKAKAKLFESLSPQAYAVVNGDDVWHECMLADTKAQIMRTGVGAQVDDQMQASAKILQLLPVSSEVVLHGPWGQYPCMLPVIGEHNICNVIQAASLAWSVLKHGQEAEHWLAALASIPGVPGRLEQVYPLGMSSGVPRLMPTVLVDYAHTPDALSRVTATLAPLTPGQLIVLYGCGGDRDRAKRPLMTQAACDHADLVILTSDNPRTEDPEQILTAAAAGFPQPPDPCPEAMIIPDRAEAIAKAIALAEPGDTVLIAGKGHEDYQIVGVEKTHFDDAEQAGLALRTWCSQQI